MHQQSRENALNKNYNGNHHHQLNYTLHHVRVLYCNDLFHCVRVVPILRNKLCVFAFSALNKTFYQSVEYVQSVDGQRWLNYQPQKTPTAIKLTRKYLNINHGWSFLMVKLRLWRLTIEVIFMAYVIIYPVLRIFFMTIKSLANVGTFVEVTIVLWRTNWK